MFRDAIPTLLLAGALTASGCKSETSPIDTPDSGMNVSDPDAGMNVPDPDGGMMMILEFPPSSKANVRFKRTERIRNDFATALGLDPNTLCLELGRYSCTDFVHTVALGGVEPYTQGIREGLEHTTITTPMAVERVALAGCEQRATADLADPSSALIFRDLGVDGDGAIPDLESPGVSAAIDTLYKRVLLRAPRESEVEHLRQLYRDLEATNEPGPARDWAILSCFSVLTTMEALFY